MENKRTDNFSKREIVLLTLIGIIILSILIIVLYIPENYTNSSDAVCKSLGYEYFIPSERFGTGWCIDMNKNMEPVRMECNFLEICKEKE